MAQKIEQFSRLVNHRLTGSGVPFTVPTSNDHTDETWSNTDLYIGEIGINVTDDTIYMRTNNGIIQIATGTVSSGSASATIWTFNGSEVVIGATYTATAVIRNSNGFTDLGSTTWRWKDLHLGGSSDGWATINVNGGFTIRDASNFLITQVSGGSNIAAINLGLTASNGTKELPLHLNSNNTTINGFGGERTIMSSYNTNLNANSNRVAAVACEDVTISAATNTCLYVGQGQGRAYDYTNSLGVGGRIVLKGVEDDGSNNYDRSEVVKGQTRLTTSNALETPIFYHSWDTVYGESMQVRAMVMGVNAWDSTKVYSTEILVTGCYGTNSGQLIGDPIINEVSSFDDSIYVTGFADNSGLEIHVKGSGTETIQWLCSYEYHRIINIGLV
jgi:hypothetical protein